MKKQNTSLVHALQMKPSSQQRTGRFIYTREHSTAKQNSQAGCSGGNCGTGSCVGSFS